MTKQQTIDAIENVIATAEKYKSAYFFTPPTSASERRRLEKKASIDEFSWKDGKDKYTAEYEVRCSCRNVYASGFYTKNGKKTTLLAVKNSLKRLKGGK